MTSEYHDPWTKRLLRAGYGCSLTGLVMATARAGRADGQPRVFYGGARAGDRGGPLVKVKRLSAFFPEDRWRYNLVYTLSNAPYLPAIALKLLKARGIPIVSNQNGVFYPAWYGGDWRAKNAGMARAYHLADHVFWQSAFCRRAAERFLGAREGPGEVLYNAVDTRRFAPATGTERGNALKFLVSGKIDGHLFYRLESSLRGLALARKQGLEARLQVAGWVQPAALRAAQELGEELGLTDAVVYSGSYTQDQAPEIYRAADAYVMTKHNDPCPNTVLEALASGLPVVYSDSGGVPELVGEEAGVALPCEEDWERARWPAPRSIADGMIAAAENRETLSAAARRRAVDRFDIAQWIDRHGQVFGRLITGSA